MNADSTASAGAPLRTSLACFRVFVLSRFRDCPTVTVECPFRSDRHNAIAEIHRIRREIAARFQGDVFAINADAQARSEASGRMIIRRGLAEMDGGTEGKSRGESPAVE